MRPVTNHFAEALRLLWIASLLGALAACGGPSGTVVPETDPATRDWSTELAAAEQNRTQNPAETYWPYRTAEIHLAMGNPAQAEYALAEALEIDRDHGPATLLLSKILYQSERHEEAIALLEAALNRGTVNADAMRIALALNYESLGAGQAAREALAQCDSDRSLRPNAETFLSLRGDDYLHSRPAAEAALAADPDIAANHNNFGIALLYDGEPEAAREAFLTALELDTQLSGALYNLAIVETYYFYDLDKGREWFSRYAELDTDDPDELGVVFGIELAAIGASPWTAPEPGGENDAQ